MGVISDIHRHTNSPRTGFSFYTDKWPYNKLCFVTIPKCASSSIRLNMKLNRATYLPDSSMNGRIVFCVIREPLARFVSGYCEMLRRQDKTPLSSTFKFWTETDPQKQFMTFLDSYEKYGSFEGHLNLQLYSIKGLTIQHHLRFEHINNDLNRMLRLHRMPKIDLPNDNKMIEVLKSTKATVSELVQKPEIKQRIMTHLRHDYELYNSLVSSNILGTIPDPPLGLPEIDPEPTQKANTQEISKPATETTIKTTTTRIGSATRPERIQPQTQFQPKQRERAPVDVIAQKITRPIFRKPPTISVPTPPRPKPAAQTVAPLKPEIPRVLQKTPVARPMIILRKRILTIKTGPGQPNPRPNPYKK